MTWCRPLVAVESGCCPVPLLQGSGVQLTPQRSWDSAHAPPALQHGEPRTQPQFAHQQKAWPAGGRRLNPAVCIGARPPARPGGSPATSPAACCHLVQSHSGHSLVGTSYEAVSARCLRDLVPPDTTQSNQLTVHQW